MSRVLIAAIPRTAADIAGDAPSVFTFGAIGDGIHDDTAAIIAGITSLVAVGGGSLYFPGGYTYSVGLIDFSAFADVPLTFYGDGSGSLIIRNSAITSGDGWWNIAPKTGATTRIGPIKFRELGFEGIVTTSVGYLYSAIPGDDPMDSILTTNSSFWVKGGCSNITWDNVLIQHTGGYAILLDARTANVGNIRVRECDFLNNRPHLFGEFTAIYGSWTGGIHYQMDGISTTTSVTNLEVTGCLFSRGTGNQVWGHAYSVTTGYHNRIRVNNNWFEDIGMDSIEMGQVLGCSAIGNDFRRSGYICSNDTSPSVPMWESGGVFAVALDTTGVVKDGVYGPNEFLSINGAAVSADGLCYSTITGNTARIPVSGDPEYTTDSIATFGPGGTGANWSQGIITDNTANQEGGGGLTVSGNTFYNFGGTNLGAYACRNGHWVGNRCYLPNAPNQAPAAFGNQSTGANQRTYNSTMVQTYFYWTPGSASPCIIEDATGGAFSSTDQNLIIGTKIFGNGNAYEFQRNTNTISAVRDLYGTNSSSVVAIDQHYIQEEGNTAGFSTAMKWYFQNPSGAVQHMQLQAFWASGSLGPLLNVSAAGVGGVLATGGRTTSLVNDGLVTGMVYGDDFFALTDTTYADANANLFNLYHSGSSGPAVVALLRYKGSVGYFEQSLTISGGARVWTPFGASFWAASGANIYNTNTGNVGVGITNATAKLQVQTSAAAGSSVPTSFGLIVSGSTNDDTRIASVSGNWVCYIDVDSSLGFAEFATYTYGVGSFPLSLNGNGSPVWIGTYTDDGSGAVLQMPGFVSATVGYYSVGSAADTVNIPNGGVTALSLISTRNDGASGVTINRTTATARRYGFAINSSGALLLNDDTASVVRMSMDTTGLFSFGGTNCQIDQSGDISAVGTLALTGTGSGINVSGASGASINYNAIQVSGGGGMFARSFTSLRYIQTGSNSGVPTATNGDTITNNGCMYYDTSLNTLQARINGAWVALASGSAGVSSITGTANQILANGTTTLQTGAVTLTLPSGVTISTLTLTSASSAALNATGGVTCATVTSAGVVQSSSAGSSIAFQTGSPFNFQVNGNGVVACQQVNVAGLTSINSSNVFVGAGVLCGNSGIGGAGFNPWVSGSSYSSGVGTGASPVTATIATTSSLTIAGGSVVAVTAVSDSRLKTVVDSFRHGVEALKKINPIIYEWNATFAEHHSRKYPNVATPSGRHLGFIAQEVAEAMPEAGFVDADGWSGYNQNGIIAALVVAAKQIDARLEQLERRI